MASLRILPWPALCIGLWLGALTAPVNAQPVVVEEVDIEFFHEELAPHGEWVPSEAYGRVWIPHHMPPGWRPYTAGHWVYTDGHGWLWTSDWDWGWAPFHYGRWVVDAHQGWCWVPGSEWGPAWVAWRTGGRHVGWAPLPPEAGWEVNVGLRTGGIDLDLVVGPRHWTFVEERYLLEPTLHTHFVAPARKVFIYRTTRNATHYAVVNGRVVNRSVAVARIEGVIGRPVQRHKIRTVNSSALRRRGDVAGGEVRLFRPKVVKRAKVGSPHGQKGRRVKLSPNELKVRRVSTPSSKGVHPEARHGSRENVKQRAGKTSPGTSSAKPRPQNAKTRTDKQSQKNTDKRLERKRKQSPKDKAGTAKDRRPRDKGKKKR